MPNLKLMKSNLILYEFAWAELRLSTLVSALKDEKKGYLSGLRKAISIIKDYVVDLLHPFLEKKTAPEIWSILEDCYWYISPMNILVIFSDGCKKKSMKFKNILDNISSYQVTYHNIASLV